MKNLKIKNGLNNNFTPPPPPQCAVNEALTSLFCLLAFLLLYACSSSDPTPTPPNTTTHKVTFNPNTPSASSATVSNLPAEQNVDEGDLATKPTTLPTLDGYTFGGWYTEANATTPFQFSTKITKATILYAKWTPRPSFTITYHANKPSGAPEEATVTGVPENPVSISEGQTATTPTPPTLTGYDFAEWYTEATATNPYDFSQVITANVDLYAKWNIQQFTVTYHANKPQDVTANVTGVPDPVIIDYNQPATLPTPPTLTGYNFVGWYTEATATNQFNFSQVITANIDLYAKWSQYPVVTFDTKGGSDIESQRLSGTTKRATRPDNDPTREDYTFDNWYTTAETGRTQFNFDQDITAQSTIVYARWNRIQRTITYHGNKPDTVPRGVSITNLPDPATVNVDSGETTTAPTAKPELQDYDFQGWFVGTTTGTILRLENTAFAFRTTAIQADLLMYAKWSRTQITVTFHGRKPSTAPTDASITGLTTDPTIVTVNSGETTTAPIPAPLLTGYVLEGWYKATASTTGTVTLESTAFDFTLPIRGENINLYTKWLQQFTVTYHGNKPSDAPDDATVTGVSTTPITVNSGVRITSPTPPTLTDYNFVAWYTEATATNQFDFSQGITANIDLYAKWSQDPVVTFDTQGGSAIEPQRLTETPKRATRPQENPTREDYTFENWYTTAETGTTQFNFGQDITAQSTIVYARWNRIMRTVTYHGNRPDTVPRGVSVTSLPDPATVNVDSGDTATEPTPKPELQDYVFQGWFIGTISGGTLALQDTAFAFETTAIKENKDLYAKWTRKEITISFYGNKPNTAPEGASITGLTTDPTIVTVNSGDRITTPIPAPELQDYDFQGWFARTTTTGTTPILEDTAFAFTTTTIRGENINLYAKWTRTQITITYHGRKPSTAPTDASITGLTTDPTIVTVNSGDRTTALTPPPELTGYTLDGWYKATASTTGTVTLVSTAFDFEQPIRGENINLYTKWIRTYTITFNHNYGEMPATVTEITDHGGKVSPPDLSMQRPEGFTLIGWFKNNDGSDKIDDFATEVFNEDITLYAKWVFRPKTKVALVAEINSAITDATPSPNLNYIDTSLITDMSELFKEKRTFNGNISSWNVSKVENMSGMFREAVVFNGNISSWNVSKVTNMSLMFNNTFFNQNISSWNVSLVKNMIAMFGGANKFNQNISSWNVSNVKNMSNMFVVATAFNQNISSWNVAKVTDMSNMFNFATAFNQNISSWNVDMVNKFSAFRDNSALSVANTPEKFR